MDRVDKELKKGELVSVMVLAYRVSATVIETLESIYRQTYLNLELVIAEDGSDDDTLERIQEWIVKKGSRFEKVRVVASPTNTGTSKNANRGVAACSGEWVKMIDGDDLMLPECIERYMEQVERDQGKIKIYQADEEVINEKGEVIGYFENERQRMRKLIEMKTVEEQYQYFLFNDIKVSPTLFFSKSVFDEVGGCDERIRNIQDYPIKLHFLQNGYRMGYVEHTTMQYRMHDSISHRTKEVYPVNHLMQRRDLKKLCCYPYISKLKISYWISEALERFEEDVILYIFRNQPSLATKCFMKVMGFLIPRQWERRITAWKSNTEK